MHDFYGKFNAVQIKKNVFQKCEKDPIVLFFVIQDTKHAQPIYPIEK